MSKRKASTTTDDNAARISFDYAGKQLNVLLGGSFIDYDVARVLKNSQNITDKKPAEIFFKNDGIETWDSSLLLVVFQIMKNAKAAGLQCDISDLPENLQNMINLAFAVNRKPSQHDEETASIIESVGKKTIDLITKTTAVFSFVGEIFKSIGRALTAKSVMRGCDFGDALNECGPKAMGIVTLISFLVGLILAFVGAVQLKEFGAQIYVASLVTIGMCRIMGAIMVGIIMAGRTGSAYAATIGTMQVNEELDALRTMGLSITDFLVMPRVLALILAMPILTMVADFTGMLGGASVGVFMLDIPYQEYVNYSLKAFKLNNFLIGIFHGICFGVIIAVCGCYQGVNCGRNADSVGLAATKSVVSAIVAMIVATGIITVICQGLGI